MADNPGWKNITPLDSKRAAEIGALGGHAKKGSKHLSTWIQELMYDEAFEANILDGKVGIKEYKGAPIKAIIQVAMTKAVNGDDKAREWLAKYGWGQKFEADITSGGEKLEVGLNAIQAEQLIRARAARDTSDT